MAERDLLSLQGLIGINGISAISGRCRQALLGAVLLLVIHGVQAAGLQRATTLPPDPARLTVVLYSRPDCSYCEQVKRDYLLPLQRDRRYAARLSVREIDQESEQVLQDFAGQSTTHARYARDQGVRLVPVVAFYRSDGSVAAPPIVGVPLRDFYQAYLEQALDQALMRNTRSGGAAR